MPLLPARCARQGRTTVPAGGQVDPRRSRRRTRNSVPVAYCEAEVSSAPHRELRVAPMKAKSQEGFRIDGQRVRTRRIRQRLSQTRLAELTGTSSSHLSTIEAERAGTSLPAAIAIADALDASLDYLVGRVDDPRPAREMASELRAKTARIRDLEEGHAEPLDPNWREHVGIDQVDTTVGADGTVREETVTRRLKFPYPWLRKHGLRAHMCRIVRMTGESMEPTIPDGSAILIDTAARDRRDGSIAVVRIDDRQVVRRLLDDPEAGWLLLSDNPDKSLWPTEPWPDGATVVGEVKWLGRTLV